MHILTVNYLNDAISVRFGLREINTTLVNNITRLTLNNETIKLHGFGRHTMWPDTGAALTYSQVLHDFNLVLESSSNFIRGCCYPQDQRFLDLCDENGILIWYEALGCNVGTSLLEDSIFMKAQIEQINEMMDSCINNPSIIIYAMYNEGASDSNNSIYYYNQTAYAMRSRDNSRLITWASDKYLNDKCIGPVADIASFNGYPGWYDDTGNISYAIKFWNKLAQAAHLKWPDKPFMISETGAGAVYEYNNISINSNKSDYVLWSQSYANSLLKNDVETGLNSEYISGISVWQFADTKANDGNVKAYGNCDYYNGETICQFINVTHSKRPGSENHKGNVDYWRRYKMSFYTILQLYNNYSTVYGNRIANTNRIKKEL